MKLLVGFTIPAALLAIVAVSLGAKIYRWEMILWPSIVIMWAVIALIYERLANDG